MAAAAWHPGESVFQADPLQPTLLQAAETGNDGLARQLLDAKADPNIADDKKVSALHLAVFNGSIRTVEALLSAGADVDIKDCFGQTPLFFAPSRVVCLRLYHQRADLNVLNHKGQSALHLAAFAGMEETAGWLAEYMQPWMINLLDRHGHTAYYCACHSKMQPMQKLLLSHGADPTFAPKPKKKAPQRERARHNRRWQQSSADCLYYEEVTLRREWTTASLAPEASRDQGMTPPSTPPPQAATRPHSLVGDDFGAAEQADDTYCPISPKRSPEELLHIEDQELIGADESVLQILAGTLGGEVIQPTMLTPRPEPITPFGAYYARNMVCPATVFHRSMYLRFPERRVVAWTMEEDDRRRSQVDKAEDCEGQRERAVAAERAAAVAALMAKTDTSSRAYDLQRRRAQEPHLSRERSASPSSPARFSQSRHVPGSQVDAPFVVTVLRLNNLDYDKMSQREGLTAAVAAMVKRFFSIKAACFVTMVSVEMSKSNERDLPGVIANISIRSVHGKASHCLDKLKAPSSRAEDGMWYFCLTEALAASLGMVKGIKKARSGELTVSEVEPPQVKPALRPFAASEYFRTHVLPTPAAWETVHNRCLDALENQELIERDLDNIAARAEIPRSFCHLPSAGSWQMPRIDDEEEEPSPLPIFPKRASVGAWLVHLPVGGYEEEEEADPGQVACRPSVGSWLSLKPQVDIKAMRASAMGVGSQASGGTSSYPSQDAMQALAGEVGKSVVENLLCDLKKTMPDLGAAVTRGRRMCTSDFEIICGPPKVRTASPSKKLVSNSELKEAEQIARALVWEAVEERRALNASLLLEKELRAFQAEEEPTMEIEQVSFTMTVEHVDYDEVMNDESLRDSFTLNVKEAVALEAGPGITAEHVHVILSAGSVIIDSTIIPPAGVQIASVHEKLSTSTSMTETVVSSVKEVPGIAKAARGEIGVKSFSLPEVKVVRMTKAGAIVERPPPTPPAAEEPEEPGELPSFTSHSRPVTGASRPLTGASANTIHWAEEDAELQAAALASVDLAVAQATAATENITSTDDAAAETPEEAATVVPLSSTIKEPGDTSENGHATTSETTGVAVADPIEANETAAVLSALDPVSELSCTLRTSATTQIMEEEPSTDAKEAADMAAEAIAGMELDGTSGTGAALPTAAEDASLLAASDAREVQEDASPFCNTIGAFTVIEEQPMIEQTPTARLAAEVIDLSSMCRLDQTMTMASVAMTDDVADPSNLDNTIGGTEIAILDEYKSVLEAAVAPASEGHDRATSKASASVPAEKPKAADPPPPAPEKPKEEAADAPAEEAKAAEAPKEAAASAEAPAAEALKEEAAPAKAPAAEAPKQDIAPAAETLPETPKEETPSEAPAVDTAAAEIPAPKAAKEEAAPDEAPAAPAETPAATNEAVTEAPTAEAPKEEAPAAAEIPAPEAPKEAANTATAPTAEAAKTAAASKEKPPAAAAKKEDATTAAAAEAAPAEAITELAPAEAAPAPPPPPTVERPSEEPVSEQAKAAPPAVAPAEAAPAPPPPPTVERPSEEPASEQAKSAPPAVAPAEAAPAPPPPPTVERPSEEPASEQAKSAPEAPKGEAAAEAEDLGAPAEPPQKVQDAASKAKAVAKAAGSAGYTSGAAAKSSHSTSPADVLAAGQRLTARLQRTDKTTSYGFQLGNLSSGQEVVTKVQAGGLAEIGQVRACDILVAINGQDVADLAHSQVIRAIASSTDLELALVRLPEGHAFIREATKAIEGKKKVVEDQKAPKAKAKEKSGADSQPSAQPQPQTVSMPAASGSTVPVLARQPQGEPAEESHVTIPGETTSPELGPSVIEPAHSSIDVQSTAYPRTPEIDSQPPVLAPVTEVNAQSGSPPSSEPPAGLQRPVQPKGGSGPDQTEAVESIAKPHDAAGTPEAEHHGIALPTAALSPSKQGVKFANASSSDSSVAAVPAGSDVDAEIKAPTVRPEPVKVHMDETGLLTWTVVLAKSTELDKYGFAHLNGKLEFLRERTTTSVAADAKSGTESLSDQMEVMSQGTLMEKETLSRTGSVFDSDNPGGDSPMMAVGTVGSSSAAADTPVSEVSPSSMLTLPKADVRGSSKQSSASRRPSKRTNRCSSRAARDMLNDKDADYGPLPETLIVKKVSDEGLLRRWNLEHPEAQVQPRDRILEVNGETGVHEMQQELRSSPITMKLVRYPPSFTVTLEKDEATPKLGFRFSKPRTYAEDIKQVLKISEVVRTTTSAMETYNRRVLEAGNYHLVVTAGMRVDRVNDIENDAANMGSELHAAKAVTLAIRRNELVEASAQAKAKAAVTKMAALRSFSGQLRGLGSQSARSSKDPE
eukprot:TRINITY_DN6483_c0_g1_i1.p1 TRINITY_DN6483_c0_g1~~TRINITY_DN6483_c0_g1_i1.p1  ORF type:complete len:2326 (-),score=505.13 TRINITY_DN6483_c0_g1_i1:121-7098(-)